MGGGWVWLLFVYQAARSLSTQFLSVFHCHVFDLAKDSKSDYKRTRVFAFAVRIPPIMHHNDLSGAALLVIAYQALTKRLSQLFNVAGWVVLILLVGWLVQNLKVSTINLSGQPMGPLVMMDNNEGISPRVESIPAELAQRTQG